VIKSFVYRCTLLLDRLLAYLPSIGSFRPLKGSFSAWDRLKLGKLEGGVIRESQEAGPCPPGSVTERASMQQHDHQPWPVFWVRSDDARLVGSLLHWRDPNDLICHEGAFRYPERRRLSEDRYFAQIIVPKPITLPGAWTSITSNWADGTNYYHWMADGLTRLLVREYLPEETRILLPSKTPSYIHETIEMLGLSEVSCTAPSPCVRPERFYFCSPTAMAGVWNLLGFDWLRDRFISYRNPSATGKPVFLTRRGATRMPPMLEGIENLFAKHGFKIVDCGKLTVKQQIQATSSAPAIAGLHGAAMTNLLWAHPGTPVLEIFDPTYLNACYEQIALSGNLKYSYYIGHLHQDLSDILKWIVTHTLE
jgi:hypothetical protein